MALTCARTPDTPENNERIYRATVTAEAKALNDLLETPVLTREDSKAKAKHLLAYAQRAGLEAHHFEPLLRSIVFDG